MKRTPIPAWLRFAAALGTWALLYLSQPGLGRAGGFGHIAFVALVPWALWCSRPGKRAFLMEWLAAGLGLAMFSLWLHYILPPVVVAIGVVTSLYVAFAGICLRRLVQRGVPFAFAVPIAWLAGELPRWTWEAPFSFGWWRLGLMAHDTGWLAGSARIWGVWGLSWTFAAFAGWIADEWCLYQREEGERGHVSHRRAAFFGVTPLLIAIGASFGTSPPATVAGPRVLLVQPGIEQARKMSPGDWFQDLYANACELTFAGLAEARAAGEPEPDLVCWGETMLPVQLADLDVLDAYRAGARPLAWTRRDVTQDDILRCLSNERVFIGSVLFGQTDWQDPWMQAQLERVGGEWTAPVLGGGALLPPGTSFSTGAERLTVRDGALRRQNAVYIWDAEARRSAGAGKLHLVPGAEDMKGTQRFQFFLDMMYRAGGYIPDFLAAEEVGVLPLSTRDGATYQVATTICYDNVFDDPYVDPLRRTDVDFHLVASNEAWYHDSVEMDHMIAFSRLIAQMTGRSIVRATNSGISCVIGPDGRNVALLEVDGRSKMVRGTLRATVPVPLRGEDGAAPETLYVASEPLQTALLWVLVALAVMFAGRSVTRAAPGTIPPE